MYYYKITLLVIVVLGMVGFGVAYAIYKYVPMSPSIITKYDRFSVLWVELTRRTNEVDEAERVRALVSYLQSQNMREGKDFGILVDGKPSESIDMETLSPGARVEVLLFSASVTNEATAAGLRTSWEVIDPSNLKVLVSRQISMDVKTHINKQSGYSFDYPIFSDWDVVDRNSDEVGSRIFYVPSASSLINLYKPYEIVTARIFVEPPQDALPKNAHGVTYSEEEGQNILLASKSLGVESFHSALLYTSRGAFLVYVDRANFEGFDSEAVWETVLNSFKCCTNISMTESQQLIEEKNSQYAVLPIGTRTMDIVFVNSDAMATAVSFEPSEEEVAKMETALRNVFEASITQGVVDKGASFDEYYRQYLGVQEENGTRLIHVRAFKKERVSMFPNWKIEQISIDGGGAAYFDAIYDVRAGDVFEFSFHGES